MSTNSITEKHVKDRIKKIVNLYSEYNHIYTFCPMTFGYGESGHPDRLLLINGDFLGVEAKKDKNNAHTRPELKPKANEVMQKRQAEKIRQAGGRWICIHKDNLDELVCVLDAMCTHKSCNFSDSDKDLLSRASTWE